MRVSRAKALVQSHRCDQVLALVAADGVTIVSSGQLW
jgi:hypothetical protein